MKTDNARTVHPEDLISSLEDLCDFYGVAYTPDKWNEMSSRITRAFYKSTDCGAWLHITSTHVTFGSCVEGSDAEVNGGTFRFPFTKEDWRNKVQEVESEVEALWKEANEGDEE